MSESYKSNSEKGIDMSEIDVASYLRQIKILNATEELGADEYATIAENAMTLCASDPSLELDAAIALSYIENYGPEVLTRMNTDRLSLLLEEVTGHSWNKEETEELILFIKNHANDKVSFTAALQRWDTARSHTPAASAQAVVNDRGEVLGVGTNREQLLRKASEDSGRL